MAPIHVIFFIERDVVVTSNDYLFLQFTFEGVVVVVVAAGWTRQDQDKTKIKLRQDDDKAKTRREHDSGKIRQDEQGRQDKQTTRHKDKDH